MGQTILDDLNGGNSILDSLRGVKDTPENREILEKIEKDNAEWERQEQERLKKLRMPKNPAQAALLAVSARGQQYKAGVQKLFGGKPRQTPSEISEEMAPVREEFPKSTAAATLATDIIATAPIGLGAGVGTARTLGTVAPKLPALAERAVTGLSMGLAEGATVGLAEDDVPTGAVVGGLTGTVAEMALPPMLRGAGKLLKKMFGRGARNLVKETGGEIVPTKELTDQLQKLGLSFDDIKGVDMTTFPADMTPDQMARRLLFEKQGVPTTRARITQSAEDFAGQVRLERMTGDQGGDLVRTRVAEESAAIQNRLRNLAEDLGVEDQAGDTIQVALQNLDNGQRKGIQDAYGELLSLVDDSNAAELPLSRDRIRQSIDEVLFGDLPVSDETLTAIKRTAAKFGIFGDEAVEAGSYTTVNFDGEKIKFNGKQTPLSLGNFEQFRQSLNRAFQRDSTGSITSVKNAVDDTVLEATDILSEIGDEREFIVGLAQDARQAVIGRGELLDTGTLVPKLLNTNPRTGTPFTEASKVTEKIFSRATPHEEVTRLVTALSDAPGGPEALKNLQADTVMRLQNAAFKNAGKLQGGQTPFNVTAFSNELRSIGPDKLKSIFGDDPALRALQEFEQIGQLMRTPSAAVQKGSAPDMVNAIIRASRLSAGLGGDIMGMAAAQVAGKQYTAMNTRAIRRQIIEMTGMQEQAAVKFMTQTYPELALALGLTAVGTKEAIE